MPDLYDLLVPWLREHSGLSDSDALAALQAPSIAVVGPITKAAFAPLLAKAIGVVYAPAFDADKREYWGAILQLWTSLDEVHPTDQSTQEVISRAVADGVLTQAEVAAQITAATRHISQIEAWGVDIQIGHVTSARAML